jgi:hypothetical protein
MTDIDVASSFASGSVVQIVGLERKPELNGRLGVVKRYVPDQGRFEVLVTQRKGTLCVRPSNLKSMEIDSAERRHQHAVFWPEVGDTIPMYAFDDWPGNWTSEEAYLRNKLSMKKPKVLSGIENRGSAKPDFQFYFDADDEVSPINQVAMRIESLLPDYELSKVSTARAGRPFRGACVLIYSPIKSTSFSSEGAPPGVGPPNGTQTVSGNADRLFSLQQLRKVLEFQESREGLIQYKKHDNPMHRMFGGMM